MRCVVSTRFLPSSPLLQNVTTMPLRVWVGLIPCTMTASPGSTVGCIEPLVTTRICWPWRRYQNGTPYAAPATTIVTKSAIRYNQRRTTAPI